MYIIFLADRTPLSIEFRSNKELYAYDEILNFKVELPNELASLEKLVSSISDLTFTNNNAIELLIDGKQTFGRMLEAIAEAKDYILLQSYIIVD